jgi:2-polyprenyl-3-methyl-5-hydroxy-6-metoxy-1,4-benzoquinol methylase
MGREIEYRRQTVDTRNPIARFAHRQRYRLSLEHVADSVPDTGVVVDYGCGDGAFLNALADLRPDLTLYGFDPESHHVPERYTLVDDVELVAAGSVDLVCCYETLEHLYDKEIAAFVGHSLRLLRDGGEVAVSVPIIGGPPLLLKELNRMVMFRRRTDYSAGELLRAAFLGKAAPRPDDVRPTHKGFDFLALTTRLEEDLELVDRGFSPFPRLPWWANSQVFLRLRPRP